MKETQIRRIRSRLELRGHNLRTWAVARGFNPKTVYSVLSGRLTGARGGVASRIAGELKRILEA